MSSHKIVVSHHNPELATYRAYVAGFVLSVWFTLGSYILVHNNLGSHKWSVAYVVAALALAQFITQITLFLHLGHETKPKYRMLVFGFMLLVVLILISGSIWVMQNLNTRMTPTQMNTYMQHQDGGI
jgi:cytochrome o ubiquinol oxidase operon protein cyoD